MRLGISYTRGNLFASRVLPIYHRKYPAVDLTLVEGNSAELCGFLENGRVDVIVDFSSSCCGTSPPSAPCAARTWASPSARRCTPGRWGTPPG
ncbi:hypothetical protein C7256_17485 [Enterocloster lavalensis]|nr:hypothetical protein C7256_17485 [Enterocloster lavalensis]